MDKKFRLGVSMPVKGVAWQGNTRTGEVKELPARGGMMFVGDSFEEVLMKMLKGVIQGGHINGNAKTI